MARPLFLLTRMDGRKIAFVGGRDRVLLYPSSVEIDGERYAVQESRAEIERLIRESKDG